MSAPLGSNTLEKRDCDGHQWGFIASNVDDPPKCIRDCRERFMDEWFPNDETFVQVCEVLSDNGYMDKQKPLWTLYCCDSQLCGVENLSRGGKDPNVNWFINTCQNIGYHSVIDPGAPDSTFTCTFDSIYDDDPRCQQSKQAAATDVASSSGYKASSSIVFKADQVTSDHTTLIALSTSRPSRTSMPVQTYSKITDPSLSASLDSSSTASQERHGDGYSVGVKVTVVLCSLLGVVAILALIFFLLRRRARHDGTKLRRHIKHNPCQPSAESPTPLVSPTLSHTDADGLPLTPPARLRERKFLPTDVDATHSPGKRPPSRPGYPLSPLYAPTTTKKSSRHESVSRMYFGGNSPPLSRISEAMSGLGDSLPDERVSSYTSDARSPTPTKPAPGYSDGSPKRPSRPVEAAFNISSLASPGPPPTRALPSTPPSSTFSPNASPTSVAHPTNIGVAMGSASRNPAQGVVLDKDSQSLSDLTEEYARDSRTSWGSWGTGGGGPRVSVSPQKAYAPSPVLEESDLERMGGRY